MIQTQANPYKNRAIADDLGMCANQTAPPPSEATLACRASDLADGLSELNRRIAHVRYRIFGDDSKSLEPECDNSKHPTVPVQHSIGNALQSLHCAFDQLEAISVRL